VAFCHSIRKQTKSLEEQDTFHSDVRGLKDLFSLEMMGTILVAMRRLPENEEYRQERKLQCPHKIILTHDGDASELV
jgi:hypothetical protein